MTGRGLWLATHAYPSWWRARYGPEIDRLMADLLDSGASRVRVAVDLVRGGLAVRLRASGMPSSPELWGERTKWSLFIAILPWMVISFPLQWLISSTSVAFNSGLPATDTAQRLAGDAWNVEEVAWLATCFAALCAWGVLFDGLRGESPRRPRPWVLALSLPLIVVFGGFAASFARAMLGTRYTYHFDRALQRSTFANHESVQQFSDHPLAARLIDIFRDVLTVGGWVASVVVVTFLVRRLVAHPELVTRGLRVARTLLALSTLQVAAAIVAGVARSMESVVLLSPSTGRTLNSLPWWWAFAVAGLGVAPLIGAFAVLTASRSRRTWQQLTVGLP